jgi:hypothetical protein
LLISDEESTEDQPQKPTQVNDSPSAKRKKPNNNNGINDSTSSGKDNPTENKMTPRKRKQTLPDNNLPVKAKKKKTKDENQENQNAVTKDSGKVESIKKKENPWHLDNLTEIIPSGLKTTFHGTIFQVLLVLLV